MQNTYVHTNNAEFHCTHMSNIMHRILIVSSAKCCVLIMFKNFRQIHTD